MSSPCWPLTRAELARRYGVTPSAITRALARAAGTAPEPVNPGEPLLRYRVEQFDPWWASRPRRGRPPATPQKKD